MVPESAREPVRRTAAKSSIRWPRCEVRAIAIRPQNRPGKAEVPIRVSVRVQGHLQRNRAAHDPPPSSRNRTLQPISQPSAPQNRGPGATRVLVAARYRGYFVPPPPAPERRAVVMPWYECPPPAGRRRADPRWVPVADRPDGRRARQRERPRHVGAEEAAVSDVSDVALQHGRTRAPIDTWRSFFLCAKCQLRSSAGCLSATTAGGLVGVSLAG